MTVEVLCDRLRQSHADFEGALEGLDAATLEAEPAVGDWSARDVVAHLTDWNGEIFLAAEHLLGGPRPPHHPIAELEVYNRAKALQYRSEPWERAKSRLDASVAHAIDLAGRFADRLDEPTEHPWNNRGTIRDLFHGVCGHQEEHTAELLAWRDRRGR
jgi:hypothetical protein